MSLRRFDLVEVIDPEHFAHGKQFYVLINEKHMNAVSGIDGKYSYTVKYDKVELVKRPKKKEIPNFVIDYIESC